MRCKVGSKHEIHEVAFCRRLHDSADIKLDVFLFDESLSNLDAKLRAGLRVELKRLHQQLENNTMVYVTHDQIEAMTLADRIAIMRGGAIQQLDASHKVYNFPINKYVAGFIGSPSINFLAGEIVGQKAKSFSTGSLEIPPKGYRFEGERANGSATLGVRPEHVSIGNGNSSMPYSHEVIVEVVEPMGSEDQKVRIGFDPARASLFDAETELRL